MKNKILQQLTITLLVLISLVACKEDWPVDFRNNMTGNYFFTINYSSFPPYALYKDTSVNCNGFIYKSNEFDNKIIVDWGPDSISFDGVNYFTQKFELTVDQMDNLSYPEYHSIDNTRFSPDAYIRNDTINFWIGSGGLGRAFIWNVLGMKISK